MAAYIPPSPNSQAVSYSELDGEWRTRKITLFGVVRSFVSQLKIGQDLTKVSLPAVLLYPYSMLEVFAYRELGMLDLLFSLNREENPLERMIHVIQWNLGVIQQETSHKKPYNPVLGEIHECYTESKEHGKSSFIGEQVSHHPPISAFYVRNDQEGITFECNLSFGVKFGGNHVSIVTDGNGIITVDRHGEQYEMPRRTPDMVVKNVVWGTKKIFWNGEVQINCAKTGYTANLRFKDSGNDNLVVGNIVFVHPDGTEEEVMKIDGKCGGLIHFTDKRTHEKKTFDAGGVKRTPIQYKLWNELDPLSSVSVWAEVNKWTILDDMEKADDAKKKVELAQRERAAEKKQRGEENLARFFEQSSSEMWIYKSKPKPEKKKRSSSSAAKRSSMMVPPEDGISPPNGEISLTTSGMHPQQLSYEEALLQQQQQQQGLQPFTVTATGTRTPTRQDSPTGYINSDDVAYINNHLTTSPSLGQVDEATALQQNFRNQTYSEGRPPSRSKSSLRNSMISIGKNPKEEPVKTGNMARDATGRIIKIADETNVMTGWMKMRNSMKIWINRWFVLRPGRLVYFKDDKDMRRDRCVGILRLADCQVDTRETHKDGFSFKISHSLHYPIYHKYGLKGETLKMARVPVSWNYCILRVGSEHERKSWMDAITEQIEYANTYDPSNLRNPMVMEEDFSEDDSDDERRRELTDDLEQRNEELQKVILDGLSVQQKSTAKSLQKRTLKTMEEWKREMDTKVNNMEKRMITEINKQNANDGRLKLTYIQLFSLVFLCIIIARYL